jgi:hypothetical protein
VLRRAAPRPRSRRRATSSAATDRAGRAPFRSGRACAITATSSSSLPTRRSSTRTPPSGASLPPTAPLLGLAGDELIEWHGGQRWLATSLPAALIREAAAGVGGHATLFRGRDKSAGGLPLPAALRAIHERLKRAFDPNGISIPAPIPASEHADRPHPRVRRHRRRHRGRRHPAGVHCGFCTATCPTYQLLGDELDARAAAST